MEESNGSLELPDIIEGNGVAKMLRNTYIAFSQRRDALGLTNPGPMDRLKKEVDTDVLLNKFMFSGLKAEINRPLSVSPMFQYAHSIALGPQLPPYGFSAMLGTAKSMMQGSIDNGGQLGAGLNYQWTKGLVTKSQVSIAPRQQSMVQLDADYSGQDFVASIKSINPSVLDGCLSGVFVGSYLQSVTPGLALGIEAMWQRMARNQGPETVLSYCARYKGRDWIGTTQLTGQGALSASYWRRLTEKVEAGVDLNLQFTPGMGGGSWTQGLRKEGLTTLGAKYDFRASTFRAQLDSAGKVACLVEKRVLPPLQIAFAGEIDHVKSNAKVGLSLTLEVTPEDVQQQASAMASSPAIPF